MNSVRTILGIFVVTITILAAGCGSTIRHPPSKRMDVSLPPISHPEAILLRVGFVAGEISPFFKESPKELYYTLASAFSESIYFPSYQEAQRQQLDAIAIFNLETIEHVFSHLETTVELLLISKDGVQVFRGTSSIRSGSAFTARGKKSLRDAASEVLAQVRNSSEVLEFARDKLSASETPSQHTLPHRKQAVAKTSGALAPSATATRQPKGLRWAVIIGIAKYQDTRIQPLRYASEDAKAFYAWATHPDGGRYAPARVKLILDSHATAKAIRNALFVWLGQALEEDIVTIYFAGHASPQSPDRLENLFLLPYDTNYEDIASTGFPMWDIETALSRFIKAKKIIVIADACHAGGVGREFDIARRAGRGIKINAVSSGLQNLSQVGDGVCVISASDENQLSQESQDWGGGHGVFTYFLLRGLRGEADYNSDFRVTLGELIPYLSEQVRRATRNAQSPTVAGRFDPALSIGQ